MVDLIVGVRKPVDISSFGVVARARKAIGVRKIGHAGTLDPSAEGVLVLGIGRGTKRMSGIVGKQKVYRAIIKLGVTSTTGDEEGDKVVTEPVTKPDVSAIEPVLHKFVGVIQQIPPVYSAIKIDGQEAYKRVRRGEEVVMKPREVKIYSIELLAYQWPLVKIRVITGPGVYIRSLAEDIGTALGTGGYMRELVREAVGTYTLKKAVALEDLKAWYDNAIKTTS
jgi:tRNA pseudouridine55 synthase